MKALILSAGFATRLRPHTNHTPKALFPIAGQPLIDIIINRLIHAGNTGIIINVHHLHDQITHFVTGRHYPVKVVTRYEKTILGTGGAIKNISDFLDDQPFIVINSDILTDIDLKKVYKFHQRHDHPATLVMHDYPIFNKVRVDQNDEIVEFLNLKNNPGISNCMAFTGIQILDPSVLAFIPDNPFVSSIDVYRKMLKTGQKIKAYISTNHYWRDIGTPESYFEAVYKESTPLAYEKAFGHPLNLPFQRQLLTGDGSDRKWYRIAANKHSMIMADHGINVPNTDQKHTAEVDSFVKIGQHLHQKKIPVPEIYHFDTFSGVVYLEDLGDVHLQTVIEKETNDKTVIRIYQSIIDQVIRMSIQGAQSFQSSWTCQSPTYDKHLILEKECQYFVDAFLNTYLELNVSFSRLTNEFEALADQALKFAVTGFMHRDLQSRNIMVSGGNIYFIDFQGGRMGPIQYDLASLFTDPYVNLSADIQNQLLDYSTHRLKKKRSIDTTKFKTGYTYCAITRILQSLGAFAYLTQQKNKPFFARFIPIALTNLNARINKLNSLNFPLLTDIIKNALITLNSRK
jgi:NDP-sugar pyrophosphorylase family protein